MSKVKFKFKCVYYFQLWINTVKWHTLLFHQDHVWKLTKCQTNHEAYWCIKPDQNGAFTAKFALLHVRCINLLKVNTASEIRVIHINCFPAPLGGFLGNHLSCRVTVMLGGLLSSAGLILSSFASSLEHLYVCMGILTGTQGPHLPLHTSPVWDAVIKIFNFQSIIPE